MALTLGPHSAAWDETAEVAVLDPCGKNVLRFFRGELLHPGDFLNPEALARPKSNERAGS